MALKFISPENQSNTDDLPWVNEYIQSYGDVGDAFPVISIISGAKGYLVLTGTFKGFLFKDSSIAKFLIEALEVWIARPGHNHTLFAVANGQGKLDLAIDDESDLSTWVKDKKGWEQKIKKTASSQSEAVTSNPFLTTPATSVVASGSKASESTDTHPTQSRKSKQQP